MALAPEDNSLYLNMERLKKTQKLIHLYRSNECLWNPQSPGYHSSTVKDDAWRRITLLMKAGLTPDQVKLQILALRSYYSQECSALQRSQQEGYSFVPRHSYFEDLQFLGNLGMEDPDEPKISCSIILDESGTITPKYSPNMSEATFFSPLASLSPSASLSKDGYTFYKMVLEPEPPNEEEQRRIKVRSTSGNDRWYPTTYCVKCNTGEEQNGCEGCEGRAQSRGTSPESRSSWDGNQCGCSKARTADNPQEKPRNVTIRRQDESALPSSRKRSGRTHQNGVFVDLGNWDDGESSNNAERHDRWPGPRLCSQNRPEWKPRYRKAVPNDDRQSNCGGWKRNNDAICQRLQDQLARQENQGGRYSEEGSEELSAQSQNCDCKNDRPRSGEDQVNAMLLQKAQKNRNSQNTPNDPAQYNNSQPISDQAYYNTQQPVENQCFCNTDQLNADPQLCSMYGCQCMYCNRTVVPQGNYYVMQQIDHNAPSYSRAAPQDNQVGQFYGEGNYFDEYGQPAYPKQQRVHCINTENREMWVQNQSAVEAPSSGQRPMAPPSRSRPQEMDSGLPQAGSQAVRAPPQSLDKVFSSNINKILQPEQPVQHPTAKKRPKPPPRNVEYVECPAYKGTQTSNDQRERSRSGNYQSQRGTNNSDEDSVGGNGQPKRSYDDANRSRKRQGNQDSDRPAPGESPCKCPASSRNQNEVRPTQRRSRHDDMVVSNPNSNYEDSPSPRRERDPDSTPSKSKVFQLQTDDSQYIECPAYSQENPGECPYSKCTQDDPIQTNREERTARRRRPPSRDRDYDEMESATSKRRSQGQDRNRPQNGDYEEQKPGVRKRYSGQGRDDNSRSKRKSDEEAYTSKRRKDEMCTDNTCPYKSTSSKRYNDRLDREMENPRNSSGNGNGTYQTSKRKYKECNDNTCPYINYGAVNAPPKERSRRRRDYSKEYEEEENETKGKYRSESLTRRQHRDIHRFEDSEKNQKEMGSYRRTRNEDREDMDDSDDNVYEPRRYRNDNRDSNKDPDRFKKYSRREDRNLPSKDNDRYQGSYRNGTEYRNNTVDECMCEDDFDSDEQDKAYGVYPIRDNGNRSRKVSDDYRRNETSRRTKSYDYEDSEDENEEYARNNNRKRFEDRAPYSRGTEKAPSYSRGTDVYESEYDCFCSDNEVPQSSMPNRSNRTVRNENQGRTRGNIDEVVADYSDYPKYGNRNSNRAPETSVPKRTRQVNQNSEDPGKNDADISNEVDGCECEPQGGEYYSKYPNGNTNRTPQTPMPNRSRKDNQETNDPGKDDRGNTNQQANDNQFFCEDCACDPNEPKITAVKERNQAGSICMALNALTESKDNKKESSGRTKKPLKKDGKEARTKPVSTSDNQSPTVKKSFRPKTGVFPRVQSRSASPAHVPGAQKSQPGDQPVKRRTSTRTAGQSSAAKRTMDTNAAANSKLPFDLNSATYFICKLQDEGNNHQYLLVVPKKPIGPPDGQRMGPGQESVKQLHCQRQCSGFQSTSWVDLSATTQSQTSEPTQPTRPSRPSQHSQTRGGGLSVLGSFRVPPVLASTALGIIKEHLDRSIHTGYREAVFPSRKMRRTLLSRATSSRPRRPVLRPSHKANAPILDENRTLLLTNNPFRDLSFGDNRREVIVLHPPVPGFRPSKNSFSRDDVEMQHITVPSQDNAGPPLPPRPPTKPRKKYPR
ncbi:serine/arginine repetitive matrix protein 2 isoform X2 [Drosophila biarmipes]|uniref:serine/arginine repetitive matrix protein 2 isoform X2 n=1 Tax=Drosophila biarmipes TaxID=125945 RepID=UPI0021CD09DD|nr:serine/arginine repetitive matrix protein 2 isoform X2 [Drosophila biarmipes]